MPILVGLNGHPTRSNSVSTSEPAEDISRRVQDGFYWVSCLEENLLTPRFQIQDHF